MKRPADASAVASGKREAWQLVNKAGLAFMVVATLGLAMLGWGVQTGVLAWPGADTGASAAFPLWGRALLRIYVLVGVALGLVLPLAALLLWGRYESVRAALTPYILVLLVQVAVEGVFANIFFRDLVVFIGLAYTLYRVGQLRRARGAFASAAQPVGLARQSVSLLLMVSLVYWSFNAVLLATVMLPRGLVP